MVYDWSQGELAEGLRCYREQDFFTAHEHWEKVWLQSAEPEKSLIQAVIQVAAACHHLQHGNVRGTISLLKSAMGRTVNHPSPCAGVSVIALREDALRWLAQLEGDAEFCHQGTPYPVIRLEV